jgi:hypothetical protein
VIASILWYLASIPCLFRRKKDMGKLEPVGKALVSAIPKSGGTPPPMCDGCHLQTAKFRVIIDGSSELFLCGHHFRRHRFALVRYKVEELEASS